jgi:hypothetical protein
VDVKVENSLQAITNLLYLIRTTTLLDPIAALIYLDLVQDQVKDLTAHLGKPYRRFDA